MSVDAAADRNARAPIWAIVLSRVLTGLATVRSLGVAGVPVHVVFFDRADPVRLSRYATRCTYFDETHGAPEDLLNLIENIALNIGERPALLATSDRDILLIAAQAKRLELVMRIWGNSWTCLQSVVGKPGLRALTESCGLPRIPGCSSVRIEDYERWLADEAGPYILKLERDAAVPGLLSKRNIVCKDPAAVLEWLGNNPGNAVVQRVIQGGDGYIFDAYGLTGRDGRLICFASHRRWRQLPAHFGTTTFGEIPLRGMGDVEQKMFEYTSRLLDNADYHGIFGIEWLFDREDGELYLIDFNARPFLSIGHLTDSGLNLPYLGYLELLERLPEGLPIRPELRHCFWVDLVRDLDAVESRGFMAILDRTRRLAQALTCTSHAYASFDDPLPAIGRAWQTLRRFGFLGWRSIRRIFRRRESARGRADSA